MPGYVLKPIKKIMNSFKSKMIVVYGRIVLIDLTSYSHNTVIVFMDSRYAKLS